MRERLRRRLDRVLEAVIAFLMAGMVLNVLWQVCTRFVLGSPSSYTEELARFALVWLGLLGAAYGFGGRLHLAMDLLGAWLGGRVGGEGRAGILLEVFTHLCVATFALLVLGVGGVQLVEMTLRLGQTSAALGIPLGFVYAVLPISAAVVLLYTAFNLADTLDPTRRDGPERLARSGR